jgi:hypothetical protein
MLLSASDPLLCRLCGLTRAVAPRFSERAFFGFVARVNRAQVVEIHHALPFGNEVNGKSTVSIP